MKRSFPAAMSIGITLFLAATSTVSAQTTTGSIGGRVLVVDTKLPSADARLMVVGTTLQVVTNERGEFRIAVIRPGLIRLTAYRIGYQSLSDTVTGAAGATATKDFRRTSA